MLKCQAEATSKSKYSIFFSLAPLHTQKKNENILSEIDPQEAGKMTVFRYQFVALKPLFRENRD